MSLIAWCCSVQALWADVMEYRKSLRALDLTDKYVKWLELRLPSMPNVHCIAIYRTQAQPKQQGSAAKKLNRSAAVNTCRLS